MKRIRTFLQIKPPQGYDALIHAAVIILMVFGSIMVVSTSVGQVSVDDPNVVARTIFKQLFFVVVSYFVMCKIAVNFFKWKRNKNFDTWYHILGFIVLGLLAATLLFPGVNGSKAWIVLPWGFTIQPSEFAKTYLIVLMGLTANHFLSKRVNLLQYMKWPFFFFIAFLLFVILQPDLGTFIVLGAVFALCFLIPSHGNLAPSQKLVKLFLILFLALVIFSMSEAGMKVMSSIFGEGYRIRRFTDAANPFDNLFDTGYNLVYSLYAIANGGIRGLGIGASEQKFGYLPEADTDFILPVTIEELGLFGLLVIALCYGFILYRLFYYARRTQSDGYRLVLVGCAAYLSIHFILNVGGVSALLPLTGVPLLLISAGGSSMLSISILLGVCQAIIAMTKNQAKRINQRKTPF